MAWLPGYAYRKQIPLTGGTDGALTDYQLKLAVAFVTDHMQSDFDDLRFTKEDGTTLIDAWLEDKNDGTSADVWVKFPFTPANGVEQTKGYMYYGKTDAVNYWDGAATFMFYTGTRTTDYISSLDISGPGYAYRGNIQYDTTGTTIGFGFGDSSSRFPDNCVMLENYPDDNHNRKVYVAGTQKLGVVAALAWSVDTPYTYDIIFDDSICKWYRDGVQWDADYTGDAPTSSIGMYDYFHAGSGQVNWAFIRKYAANPPTYTFGCEEIFRRGLMRNPAMTGGMV